MPSKYCQKCGRIVISNYIPNYCPWGCGSLKDQPLIKDINILEHLKLIKDSKRIEQKAIQLKLF